VLSVPSQLSRKTTSDISVNRSFQIEESKGKELAEVKRAKDTAAKGLYFMFDTTVCGN